MENSYRVKIFFLLTALIITTSIVKPEKQTENISFTFKKLTKNDRHLVLGWFKEPHIKKWWPLPKENVLNRYFLEMTKSKDTFGFIILLNGKPMGYIQYYIIERQDGARGSFLPPLPDSTTLGIDQFIGDSQCLYKGYGTLFIKQFIKELKKLKPDLTTIIVDTSPDNYAAIRCYEKIGFFGIHTCDTPDGMSFVMRYDI